MAHIWCIPTWRNAIVPELSISFSQHVQIFGWSFFAEFLNPVKDSYFGFILPFCNKFTTTYQFVELFKKRLDVRHQCGEAFSVDNRSAQVFILGRIN
jgi:hypothetical protein